MISLPNKSLTKSKKFESVWKNKTNWQDVRSKADEIIDNPNKRRKSVEIKPQTVFLSNVQAIADQFNARQQQQGSQDIISSDKGQSNGLNITICSIFISDYVAEKIAIRKKERIVVGSVKILRHLLSFEGEKEILKVKSSISSVV
ncbi:hypothetical protein RFI_36666 [Reticulomyxa filosa]|uniref:Uncharacterized protein n=1 Tax=Reticulomyxa filosa TaxID=46433 RepID=X6LGQ5_RETFI|nr:hypothetical protein RFI_36666 [Reticulomyxa filosa]|eukprot:ETO00774.1 hypothetical protein RFI_36666 [Reticulomyxa filosa]